MMATRPYPSARSSPKAFAILSPRPFPFWGELVIPSAIPAKKAAASSSGS